MKTLFALHNNEARLLEESAGRLELMNPMLQSGLISDHCVLDFDADPIQSEQQVIKSFTAAASKIGRAPVVICGAGVHTAGLLHLFTELNVTALADKDVHLQGRSRFGFPVISYEEIPSYAEHAIISSKAWETSIQNDLLKLHGNEIKFFSLYENKELQQRNRKIQMSAIESAIEDFKPELVVYSQAFPDERLKSEFFTSLKQKKPDLKFLNIWWDSDETADGNSHLENERDCLRYSNFVIENCTASRLEKMKLGKPPYQNHLNTENVYFHPTIFDREVFYPRNIKKDFNVAIAGSPVGNRREWVTFLQQEIPNEFTHFGGLNFGKQMLPIRKYAEEICRSKILVNTQSYSFMPQCKGKVREALSCGAFLLEEDNQETRSYVPEGAGVIYFSTQQDLLEKVSYYLHHEKERMKIALDGYNWFSKNHSPEKWTSFIFDTITAK